MARTLLIAVGIAAEDEARLLEAVQQVLAEQDGEGKKTAEQNPAVFRGI